MLAYDDHPKEGQMHARRRMARIAVAAAAACVLAAPAAAQAAGAWSFSDVTTILRSCGSDPGTGTSIRQVSTGSAAGVFKPDSTRNVRVGETFALAVDVQNVSSCDDAAVVPALRLPAGVEIADVERPVSCLFFEGSDPVGTVVDLSSSALCPQAPPTVNGFLNLGLVGAPAGVGYALADPRNGVEIWVRVVATTAGAEVADARVCDLMAGACVGSPAANVNVSVPFTVDPAQPGTQPPPGPSPEPGGTSLPETAIDYAQPFQVGVDPTSIRIKGTVTADRTGTIVAELQDMGSVTFPDMNSAGFPEETELAPVQTGTFNVDATFEDYPVPSSSNYKARICFSPQVGTKLCGPYQDVHTRNVIADVQEYPASNFLRRKSDSYLAMLRPVVVAPYGAGDIRVEYQRYTPGSKSEMGHPLQKIAAGAFAAARDGQRAPGVIVGGLVPSVQYRHRACYRSRTGGNPLLSIEKCSQWRTFTTPS